MGAKAALKAVETPRDIADRLLALHIKHADLFAQIDALKEKLRDEAEKLGKGFVEKFGEKGSVTVSGGSKGGKFSGIVPELDEVRFLALPEKERQKLIDANVIEMVQKLTKASRSSVTVKT
jgi:hypothetical protein